MRSRRASVTVAVLVVVALIGAPALATGLGVIDFGASPPAPPRVVEDFASLSAAAPEGMDPGVLAGQARQLSVDGNVLRLAPTRAGGLCYVWGRTGGCDKLGTSPLSVIWLGRPMNVPPSGTAPRSWYAVEGFVRAQWVDAVEIRLDDGTTVRPQLTWISPPIDAGFFRYDAAAGRNVVAVLGFRDGEEVIGESDEIRRAPHPYARLDERTKLAEVDTNDGPVRLWTAPTRTDGRCVWLDFDGEERAVTPCLPHGYQRQAGLALKLHDLGGTSILAGMCGYPAVELVRPGGSVRTIECRDGVVFAPLEPADLAATLQAIDSAGRPLPGSRTQVERLAR